MRLSIFSTHKKITRLWLICFSFSFMLALAIVLPPSAHSAQVTVGWNASPSSVTGYKVYYGPSSGNYTFPVRDAGNALSYTIPDNLTASSYYIAATAYNGTAESIKTPELVVYSVAASAGTGGSISPGGTFYAAKGSNQTFTITPNSGYKVAGVTVDGSSAGAVTSYTLSNIAATHSVSATFTAITNTYTITSSAGANGSISPSPSATVNSGASQTFTITPKTGYKVAGVTVDGSSVGAVTSYTFTNVTANHSISATFAAVTSSTFTITASAGANGSISPSPSATVNSGASQTFTITPKTGYKVAGVTVDGSSVGAVTSYTFTNVTANHSISASFTAVTSTYTITASAGANGSISPSPSATVNSGASQTFTITPKTGYKVAGVTVDGSSAGAVTSYTFTNVTANHSISATFAQGDQSPVADAGPAQTVSEGSLVTLNGSNSTDPANSPLSYLWTQTGGTHVSLSRRRAAKPTFTAPTVGDAGDALTFQLTVTNQAGLTSSDTCVVNVTVSNAPPTANAGPNQTVSEGTAVTLDGSNSTDPDDGIASYLWEQISGPAVTLTPTTLSQATFIASDVGQAGTSLSFRLTVKDNGGLTSTSTCVVAVTWVNSPPQANAGQDQSVYEGDGVVLDGSASSDPDDGIKSYLWKQTSGTPVTLSDPTAVQPAFTAPNADTGSATLTFQLTATDNGGLQSTCACNVYVKQDSGIDLTGSWRTLSYSRNTLSGSFTVKNAGNQRAGSSVIKFYLSDDGTTPGAFISQSYVSRLNAAQSSTVSFSYYSKWISSKYIIAVVDANDSVAESDEQNNSISAVIQTVSQSPTYRTTRRWW